MLEPLPGRSVARFMLPLADVMTVLFSLFLLLPHLEQRGGRSTGAAAKAGGIWTPEEQLQARDELVRHRQVALLPTSDRLQVIVIMIDDATGQLLLQEGPNQTRLTDAAAVQAMVDRHRAALPPNRQLFYVLQAPARHADRPRRHPGIQDHNNYRDWFGLAQAQHQVTGL